MGRQELLDMEQRLDWQDRMIDEREEAIMGIQRGVLEVNEMFRDIHALALAQAPLVDSIEQHIEHSRINVEKGVEKLEEASRAQRKVTKCHSVLILLLRKSCSRKHLGPCTVFVLVITHSSQF